MLRRHPWAVLWSAAAVTGVASIGRDVSHRGSPGVVAGWELLWLLLTVLAALVCLAAILRLMLDDRAPHVPRRRR